MGINRYLQRLAKNSTSEMVQAAAKKIHKAGAFGDRVLGVSARKSATQANTAVHMFNKSPSPHNNRFSTRLKNVAAKEKTLSSDARVKAGLAVGAAAIAKNALQKPKNDVYYDSY